MDFYALVSCVLSTLAVSIESRITENACYTPNGLNGVCVELESCASLNRIAKKTILFQNDINLLQDSHCDNSSTAVCCPDTISSTPPRLTQGNTANACYTPNDLNGVCVQLRSCASLNRIMMNQLAFPSDIKLLQDSQCSILDSSITDSSTWVCCPDTISTPSRADSTNEGLSSSRTTPKQRRSEIACFNYTSLSNSFIRHSILGGSPTFLGEFPHMAALGFPSQEFGGSEYDFNCGGSIITENYILTAAHCVVGVNLPTVVRSGRITLITDDDDDDEDEVGVTSTISEIIPHPNYLSSRRYDDIALIRVSSPIPFSDWIRPACLRSNMSDIEPDVKLLATGWGITSVERGQRSNSLLKVNLTVVPLESCNASLLGYNANDRKLRNGVNLGQICAYDPQAKHDACEGDSGGPLQIYSPNGMSTIVGVTSFGISCGSALPSVYARVAFYLDWIESIVWPER